VLDHLEDLNTQAKSAICSGGCLRPYAPYRYCRLLTHRYGQRDHSPSDREFSVAHNGLLRSLSIRLSSTREETPSPLDLECISPEDLLCAQFNEQSCGVFQIEGVEALCEPSVDLRELRAGFLTTTPAC
jgi:hypothetical protein